jgi:hypothetical protein
VWAKRSSLADIALFVTALKLARKAQRVSKDPLPQVVESLAGRRNGPKVFSEDELGLAAARATARWSRWFGGVDTCLVRSLVLAALLIGRGEVVLHIGFRPGESEANLDGHAWVTLDGHPVGADGRFDGGTMAGAFAIIFGRRGEKIREPPC